MAYAHELALRQYNLLLISRSQEKLEKLDPDIQVLVNNVGIAYPDGKPTLFGDMPNLDQFCTDMINVNIMSCTRLTALVLPAMVANGRGVIINVSSVAAITPMPLMSQYSATKSIHGLL
ncbi:unnamed protein product, partial [Oppiella nova]